MWTRMNVSARRLQPALHRISNAFRAKLGPTRSVLNRRSKSFAVATTVRTGSAIAPGGTSGSLDCPTFCPTADAIQRSHRIPRKAKAHRFSQDSAKSLTCLSSENRQGRAAKPPFPSSILGGASIFDPGTSSPDPLHAHSRGPLRPAPFAWAHFASLVRCCGRLGTPVSTYLARAQPGQNYADSV